MLRQQNKQETGTAMKSYLRLTMFSKTDSKLSKKITQQ